MKLSFNTWVYSSFPIWVPAYPLEETIRRIARIGYDGIEIAAAAPHAYPAWIWLGAGGGIVADSDPAEEHQECLNKLGALEAAIDAAERGDRR